MKCANRCHSALMTRATNASTKCRRSLGPEHTGHFVQPHVAAHCGGPEHTRATCGGDMYVMYANALSVAGRATACRTLEPQTAVCSPKLENNGFLRE